MGSTQYNPGNAVSYEPSITGVNYNPGNAEDYNPGHAITLSGPIPTAPRVSSQVSLNDPYQINSILDVLFNTAGLKKAYGNASFKSRIYAVGDILKNQYWKPMSEGDFGTPVINTVLGLSETFDAVGNVAKGLFGKGIDRTSGIDYAYAQQMLAAVQANQARVQYNSDGSSTYSVLYNGAFKTFSNKDLKMYEAVVNSGRTVNIDKLTTSERFKASIGYGDYGRINFQSDQGHGILVDILTEVILDPTTWLSAGVSAGVRLATGQWDAVLRETAKEADVVLRNIPNLAGSVDSNAYEAMAQLLEDASRKQIAKSIVRAQQYGSVRVVSKDASLNALLKSMLGNAVKTGNVYNFYNITDARTAANAILSLRGMPTEVLTNTSVSNALQRSLTKHVNTMTSNVVRTLTLANDYTNKFQGVLAKAQLTPTGVYPIYALAKKYPSIANLVLLSAKAADDIHANAMGNIPVVAYKDMQETDLRTTQVILDWLPEDVKYLYRTPEGIRKLEAQLPTDMARVDGILRAMTPDNTLEKLSEIEDYLLYSQKVPLTVLPGVLHEALQNIESPSALLQQYVVFIDDLVPTLARAKEIATVAKAYDTTDAVIDHLTGVGVKQAGKEYKNVKILTSLHEVVEDYRTGGKIDMEGNERYAGDYLFDKNGYLKFYINSDRTKRLLVTNPIHRYYHDIAVALNQFSRVYTDLPFSIVRETVRNAHTLAYTDIDRALKMLISKFPAFEDEVAYYRIVLEDHLSRMSQDLEDYISYTFESVIKNKQQVTWDTAFKNLFTKDSLFIEFEEFEEYTSAFENALKTKLDTTCRRFSSDTLTPKVGVLENIEALQNAYDANFKPIHDRITTINKTLYRNEKTTELFDMEELVVPAPYEIYEKEINDLEAAVGQSLQTIQEYYRSIGVRSTTEKSAKKAALIVDMGHGNHVKHSPSSAQNLIHTFATTPMDDKAYDSLYLQVDELLYEIQQELFETKAIYTLPTQEHFVLDKTPPPSKILMSLADWYKSKTAHLNGKDLPSFVDDPLEQLPKNFGEGAVTPPQLPASPEAIKAERLRVEQLIAGQAEFFARHEALEAKLRPGAYTLDTDLGTHAGVTHVEKTISDFQKLMPELSPTKRIALSQQVEAYESLVTMKQETFKSLTNIMSAEETNTFIDNIRSGPFSLAVKDVFVDVRYTDEDRVLASKVLDMIDNFESTKALVFAIQMSDTAQEFKQALFSTIMRYYNVSTESFDTNYSYFVDDILKNMVNYPRYSKQFQRRLSLNNLMKEGSEYHDAVKKVFDMAGEAMPTTETHVVSSDALIPVGLLYKEAEKGNEAVQHVLDNNVIISLDIESMNTNPFADANTAHQVGFQVFYKGEHLGTYSQALNEKDIEKRSPMRDYLLDLHDSLEHDKAKLERQTYEPINDYSNAELMKEYIAHIQLGNTVPDAVDESELYLNLGYEINKYIQEYATYSKSSTGSNYNVTLVTQNGESFDLALLRSKFNAGKLYDRAFKEKRYGYDLNIINNLQSIDTLKMLQKVDGYYTLSGVEEATARKMFMQYTASSAATGHAFTALNTEDLRMVRELVDKMDNTTKIRDANPHMITEIMQQESAARRVVTEVAINNKELKKGPISSKVFTSPDNQLSWYMTMAGQLGMSAAEIKTRFGERMSNAQISSILAAPAHPLFDSVAEGYQTIAYKKMLDPKLLDTYGMHVSSLVALKKMSYKDINTLMTVFNIIDRTAKKARNYLVYDEYVDDMSKLIAVMYSDVERFKFLRSLDAEAFSVPLLRTTGYNTPETWGVFEYLCSKHTEEELETLFKTTLGEERGASLLKLHNIKNKYTSLTQDKYFDAMTSDTHQVALAYKNSLGSVMSLRSNFEKLSHWQDDKGFLSGAATITMRAMEPVINVMDQFYKYIKELPEADLEVLLTAEETMTDVLMHQQLSRLVLADAPTTVSWLAENYGCALVEIDAFRKMGGIDAYNDFISKLNSKEFKAMNVSYKEQGDAVLVHFTPDSGFKAHLDSKTGVVSYHVNGGYITPVIHPRIDGASLAAVYGEALNPVDLQNALDALEYLSDGASRGTMFDTISHSVIKKYYESLPDSIKKDMLPMEVLDNPILWNSTNFNNTILGSARFRSQYGVGHSGRMLDALRSATERRVHARGAKQVYLQSMLSETNALQNSELGKQCVEHADEVATYMKDNSNFTGVALVKTSQYKYKQGFKLIECDMTTKAGVQNAYRLNARIVSVSEYNKLYEVINTDFMSETFVGAWQQIVRTFKVGYLFNFGTWGRNTADAYLKNIQTAGGDIMELNKGYATAIRDIQLYEDTTKLLMDINHGTLPMEGQIRLVLEKNKNMSYERYVILRNFFSNPASGGEARLFTNLNSTRRKVYLKQLERNGSIEFDESVFQQAQVGYNQFVSTLMAPMNYIERVSRLAAFQTLSKQGHTNDTALRLVEATHFAYSTKSETERILELFIPFYTFASRNITYWMDTLENNPAYLVTLRDVLDPVFNLDEYAPEELEGNGALQRNVLSGNIKLTEDFMFSMNFSFMDALKWLTNPLGQAKSSVFTPVQAFVNVWLQNASDENYLQGQEALSNWMQNAFGLKITKEQVEAKYGAWAAEYEKLYSYRISNLDPTKSALDDLSILQLIPLIGSQIQRTETTKVYFDDEERLKAALYFLGVGNKVNRWQGLSISKDVNQSIGTIISENEDLRAVYSRLKYALGYGNTALKDLPLNVKQTILALMQGTTIPDNTLPVLQDGDAMQFMWTALKRQYDVSDISFTDIDKNVLNSMYKDIAKSVVRIASIRDMLTNDEASRITYSIARKNLGLEGLSVYQLPLDALEVIEFAMKNHVYGTGYSSKTQYSKRSYAAKTYTPEGNSPGYHGGYSGQTPYDTSKGVYANYGHADVQKQQYNDRTNFYEDHYTQSGLSRMKMAMLPITPANLPSRVKDMFYYYR